ncbi:toprim domain-containing protein [Alkalimarinus alittae]|uniref:Toprim domain-containing protein n=1 Tax=Alkalimarinus alittae TaxID=2961619 RepID=A0ABY6N4P0_9ALTE|nr:toprim domain-containing protein [Alkalimarinus alittae]UZE96947.1 toprim domain-containing protein [Alkalimarinus alittae]
MNTIELAKGNYQAIYAALFPDLKYNTKHQPCIICGGKDRFRFFSDYQETGGAICNQCGAGNGITWVMRALGCNFKEASRQIESILGINRDNQNSFDDVVINLKKQRQKQEAKEQTRIKALIPYKKHQLNTLLAKVRPITEVNAALDYLCNRGLGELIASDDLPEVWGAVESLEYNEESKKAIYPALVAPVVSSGELVNVHRTYIANNGQKAPVEHAKKLMPSIYPGAMKGAAIKLYPAGSRLAIAEGIETALAVRVAKPDLPVWATVTAYGMKTVKLPGMVAEVFIMADLDATETGEKAAIELQKRLQREGRKAVVCLPDGAIPEGAKGIDWLDMLNQGVAV